MEKSKKPKKTLKLVKEIPLLTKDNIEEVYKKNFGKDENDLDNVNYNNFLIKKEALNREIIMDEEKNNSDSFSFLYPSLDDPQFNIKISEKKEFNDTKYDGSLYEIEKQAKILCEADFELNPHQLFVRNFLSFQTPYNSLLLYHGLGTGKTCSAITIAEEMRTYLKQLGIGQRIIVVASENVQNNFKLQLFDERKLKLVDGIWNLKACTGNKYLKEINPMNMKGLSKENVIKQIKRIINNSYIFFGYTEFANYIVKKSKVDDEDLTPSKRKKEMIKKLKQTFNNRMIIIDEIQNVRITDDNKDKRVAMELFKLVKYADNLRLLFLSATPMYNSYKEIIWILNILNLNDRRSQVELNQIFDKDGNFLIAEDGTNIGENLLKQKATGYISFVRGENPYTFPYRIFPSLFSPKNTFKELSYPRTQLNGTPILQPLEHIDVYVNNCGEYQEKGYAYIISELKKNSKTSKEGLPTFDNMESFGYTLLQKPLLALNMVYPYSKLDEANPTFDSKTLIGSTGLKRIVKWTETTNPPTKKNFEYKTKEYNNIFSPSEIGKYSSKIKNITNNILNSDGIVLIYSQFIDGGLIPMALALEELGFSRFGTKASNLFKSPPAPVIDSITFKTKEASGDNFRPATYTMITGETALSPDKIFDLKNLTDDDNKNGEKIKVVLISKTGAEGIDFKNLRQVHILEPWYNLNLIEQIIGRAVRTCSHKQLPFIERNVEIFLYGTLFNDSNDEAADLYIYRLAELKAVQIGRVSRALKESSVDCILNIEQTNFTEENMNTIVKQKLSNKLEIDFPIGDKPFTVSCDYMETCNFKCKPFKEIKEDEVKLDTYDESFIFMNTDKIISRIKELFKMNYFYSKDDLIANINVVKNYPLVQINAALTQLIDDKNEYITDKYDRLGNLVNIDLYYFFQPLELNNENIPLYDRKVPIEFKRPVVEFPIKEDIAPLPITLAEEITVQSDKKPEFITQIYEYYKLGSKNINKVERGEENWYVYFSKVKSELKSQFNVSDELLEEFLISHITESLLYNETFELVNYLYFSPQKLTDFEKLLKSYYDKLIITENSITGIIFVKDNKYHLLIQDSNSWIDGQIEDYSDLREKIKKFIIEPITNLNIYVGFMGDFKNELKIFKVKNMTDPRSKGARCDQSGKSETIKLLNLIIGTEMFTSANTKGRNKTEFCVLQEMILRKYNNEKKNEKIWFLLPCEAAINNIEKIHF